MEATITVQKWNGPAQVTENDFVVQWLDAITDLAWLYDYGQEYRDLTASVEAKARAKFKAIAEREARNKATEARDSQIM